MTENGTSVSRRYYVGILSVLFVASFAAVQAKPAQAQAKDQSEAHFFWVMSACVDYFRSGSRTWFSRQKGERPHLEGSMTRSPFVPTDVSGMYWSKDRKIGLLVGQRETSEGEHLYCGLEVGGAPLSTDVKRWIERGIADGALAPDRLGKEAFSVCNHRARRAVALVIEKSGRLQFKLTSLLPAQNGQLVQLPPCAEGNSSPLGQLNRPFNEDL